MRQVWWFLNFLYGLVVGAWFLFVVCCAVFLLAVGDVASVNSTTIFTPFASVLLVVVVANLVFAGGGASLRF